MLRVSFFAQMTGWKLVCCTDYSEQLAQATDWPIVYRLMVGSGKREKTAPSVNPGPMWFHLLRHIHNQQPQLFDGLTQINDRDSRRYHNQTQYIMSI